MFVHLQEAWSLPFLGMILWCSLNHWGGMRGVEAEKYLAEERKSKEQVPKHGTLVVSGFKFPSSFGHLCAQGPRDNSHILVFWFPTWTFIASALSVSKKVPGFPFWHVGTRSEVVPSTTAALGRKWDRMAYHHIQALFAANQGSFLLECYVLRWWNQRFKPRKFQTYFW